MNKREIKSVSGWIKESRFNKKNINLVKYLMKRFRMRKFTKKY